MKRIIDVIEGETAELRANPGFDTSANSLIKNRLLLDLHRLAPEQVAAPQLQSLRDALAANALELSSQLDAMKRRTALAVAALKDDQHDGTYRSARHQDQSRTEVSGGLRQRWNVFGH